MLKGLNIMYWKRILGMGALEVSLFGIYQAYLRFQSEQSQKKKKRAETKVRIKGNEHIDPYSCVLRPSQLWDDRESHELAAGRTKAESLLAICL